MNGNCYEVFFLCSSCHISVVKPIIPYRFTYVLIWLTRSALAANASDQHVSATIVLDSKISVALMLPYLLPIPIRVCASRWNPSPSIEEKGLKSAAQKNAAAEIRKAATSGACKVLFLVTNPVIGVFVAVCVVGLSIRVLLRWVVPTNQVVFYNFLARLTHHTAGVGFWLFAQQAERAVHRGTDMKIFSRQLDHFTAFQFTFYSFYIHD